MKKNLLAIAIILFTPFFSGAQSFKNGYFENTVATACRYNLANADFNSLMADVISFGNTPHIGLLGEADIITGPGCMGGAYDGWSVTIACEATTTDRLALKLDAFLVPQAQYQLTFKGMSWTAFSQTIHPVAVGYSGFGSSLGTILDTVIFSDSAYSTATINFTPTIPAQYITITVVPDGSTNGSVMIDNFELSIVSSLDNPDANFSIGPNPAKEKITLHGITAHAAEVFDLTGKLCKSVHFTNSSNTEVVLDDLQSGIYLLKITTDKGTFNRKFVKE